MKNTFGIPIIPANDAERLAKLNSYNLTGTPLKTGNFKHIAAMARQIFNTSIALVSFVDKEIVFLKGNVGMEGMTEAERGISLCSLAILSEEVTVFENAEKEPCLLDNPLVRGSLGLRFYAGAPITTSEGYKIGVVCVADAKPGMFSESDKRLLESLAAAVMDELEERKSFNLQGDKDLSVPQF